MSENGASGACVMYLGDDCTAPTGWRPANLPFRPDESFCREHAVDLARHAGLYGVYHRDRPDTVEELPIDCDLKRLPNVSDLPWCHTHSTFHTPASGDEGAS